MLDPERTKTPERAAGEQEAEAGPTLRDLVDFAEFDIDRTRKAAEGAAAENPGLVARLQTTAKEKADVRRALQGLVERGIRTFDEAFEILLRAAGSNDAASLPDSVRKQKDSQRRAVDFLGRYRMENVNAQPDFKTWRGEKQAAQDARRAEAHSANVRVEQAQTEVKIEAVRQRIGLEKSSETEKQREAYVRMALEDGGFRVFESIEADASPSGRSGFSELKSRSSNSNAIGEDHFLQTRDDAMRRVSPAEILRNHGINEIVTFNHQKEDVFENVPEEKGMFGRIKKPASRQRTGEVRPVLHSQVVAGGKSEPAVNMSYVVRDIEEKWRAHDGRPGQLLQVEITLPESAAKEIEKQLQGDPALIREIVGRIMKEKILKDPQRWERPRGEVGDPLRPPYEKWDARAHGGRIYIQKEGVIPGWHDEFVHKVKD